MEENRSKGSWRMGWRGSIECGKKSSGQGGGAESVTEGKGEGQSGGQEGKGRGRKGKGGVERDRE